MSTFTFPASIKSRPVYSQLQAQQGGTHMFIADAEGALAILAVAEQNSVIFKHAQILFIPKHASSLVPQLEALNPKSLFVCPSYESALPKIKHLLQQAKMGLTVYLTGTESLIGQAQNEAMQAGIPHQSIQTEHRGSTARRMQCVHCKGITEDVTTDPFVCSHCQLNLFVRDHYSRRLAAFQGVCIDAEDPGNVPSPVELYS